MFEFFIRSLTRFRNDVIPLAEILIKRLFRILVKGEGTKIEYYGNLFSFNFLPSYLVSFSQIDIHIRSPSKFEFNFTKRMNSIRLESGKFDLLKPKKVVYCDVIFALCVWNYCDYWMFPLDDREEVIAWIRTRTVVIICIISRRNLSSCSNNHKNGKRRSYETKYRESAKGMKF